MAASLVLKLSCALLACIVVFAPQAEAVISCGTVVSKVSACIPYLQGKGGITPPCCAGVRSLNALARTTPDRQTACGCLKSDASSVPGIKPALSRGLAANCGVKIPYKISPSTDCSKVR